MNKVEMNKDNFYLCSKARFKGCKRPKRKPDFTSYNRRGIVSSEYWYGEDKKGEYVIRSSDHWSNSNDKVIFSCEKIASCYWWLVTNGKSFLPASESGSGSVFFSGKAYFTAFSVNS